MANEPSSHYSRFEIEPLGAYFSAQVSGVDLSKQLDDETVAELQSAFVENEVLVFRNQVISTEDQIRFGKLFGELTVHPFAPSSGDRPEVIVFDNKEDNPPYGTDVWHSDETFRECPPQATCLRALQVPQVGGDTIFASMTAAYEGLSDRKKNLISGLEAVHDIKPFKKLFANDEAGRKQLQQYEMQFPPISHPIVRTHPVTARKSLFVNPQFTLYVKNMDENESRSLLLELFDLVKVPEYQYRHHWYDDTVVLWDNRSVQHYAVHDYWPKRRHMERITIGGDKPFSAQEKVDPTTIASRKTPHPMDDGENFGGHAPKQNLAPEKNKADS